MAPFSPSKTPAALWGPLLFATAAWLAPAEQARAYSPSHPKVQAMVSKARTLLSQSSGQRMGESALIALALIKSGSDDSDAKVQEGVAAIREALKNKQLGSPINYNVAVAIIFLVENDPIKYRSEIQALLDVLLERQEGHGGWSYWPGEGSHGRETGDSSQTQYATLALWSARRANFDVPQEACEGVARYWIGSQTPQGAWPYQGRPAALGQRVEQPDVRPSIAVAGISSCYVIGELFGLGKRQAQSTSNVSSVLQRVQETGASSRYLSPRSFSLDLLRQTISLGDRYIEQMHRGYEGAGGAHGWTIIYYMYAMERYRSFQELYQGKQPESQAKNAAGPKWYDDGVEFLEKTQRANGGWKFDKAVYIDTAFAVLFLMRSTQKTIEREFGDGLVRGGRGLPADIRTAVIDEETGVVINPDAAGTIEQLMAILDDPNNSNFSTLVANPDSLVESLVRPEVDEDEAARRQRIERLRNMVSQGTYQQRLVAVKALARTGDLDHAPLLLYALTDPDPRVRQAAEEGLRFLSRKLEGFGLPEDPQSEEFKKMLSQWRQWYLAIRPDGELLD